MSKCLEALERLKKDFQFYENGIDEERNKKDIEIIEKELKALEIIKEKKVDMTRLTDAIKRDDLSYYNYYCYELLAQQEYDLLKEVLL